MSDITGVFSTAFGSMEQRHSISNALDRAPLLESRRLAREFKIAGLTTAQVSLIDSQLLDQIGIDGLLGDPEFSRYASGANAEIPPITLYHRKGPSASFEEQLDLWVRAGNFTFSALPADLNARFQRKRSETSRVRAFDDLGGSYSARLRRSARQVDAIFPQALRRGWHLDPKRMGLRYHALVSEQVAALDRPRSAPERYLIQALNRRLRSQEELDQTVVDRIFTRASSRFPSFDYVGLKFFLQIAPYHANFADAHNLHLAAYSEDSMSTSLAAPSHWRALSDEFGPRGSLDVDALNWRQVEAIRNRAAPFWTRPDVVHGVLTAQDYPRSFAEGLVEAIAVEAPEAIRSATGRLARAIQVINAPQVRRSVDLAAAAAAVTAARLTGVEPAAAARTAAAGATLLFAYLVGSQGLEVAHGLQLRLSRRGRAKKYAFGWDQPGDDFES